MAVGEHAEQHQLELLPFADDCALDLVDDASGQVGQLAKVHQTLLQSDDDAFEFGDADARPVASGGRASIRPDELPRILAEDGMSTFDVVFEIDAPPRGKELSCELHELRAEAEVHIERRASRHRDLTLEVDERRGTLDHHSLALEARREGRRRARVRGAHRIQERDRGEPEDDEQPDVHLERCALRRDSESGRDHDGGDQQQLGDPPGVPHQLSARSRSSAIASSRWCSARISAARSSVRTASSASIASCFISGATSCPENLAHAKRSVKREVARRLTSRSVKMRCRYSSGASAGLRGSP